MCKYICICIVFINTRTNTQCTSHTVRSVLSTRFCRCLCLGLCLSTGHCWQLKDSGLSPRTNLNTSRIRTPNQSKHIHLIKNSRCFIAGMYKNSRSARVSLTWWRSLHDKPRLVYPQMPLQQCFAHRMAGRYHRPTYPKHMDPCRSATESCPGKLTFQVCLGGCSWKAQPRHWRALVHHPCHHRGWTT